MMILEWSLLHRDYRCGVVPAFPCHDFDPDAPALSLLDWLTWTHTFEPVGLWTSALIIAKGTLT